MLWIITYKPNSAVDVLHNRWLHRSMAHFLCDSWALVTCFSTKPRHWLGRTSPKWPILCRVGPKILTQWMCVCVHVCLFHIGP